MSWLLRIKRDQIELRRLFGPGSSNGRMRRSIALRMVVQPFGQRVAGLPRCAHTVPVGRRRAPEVVTLSRARRNIEHCMPVFTS